MTLSYQRILVPLDGTDCSEAALPHAHALAEKFGAELILLRVVEPSGIPPVPPTESGLWVSGAVVSPDEEERREASAQAYITQLAARYREQGGVVTEVEWGGAADQIAHCAQEHGADLIVMGTHGRHGLERLLLGSTAENLLHQTSIPLLLVKHPPTSP